MNAVSLRARGGGVVRFVCSDVFAAHTLALDRMPSRIVLVLEQLYNTNAPRVF